MNKKINLKEKIDFICKNLSDEDSIQLGKNYVGFFLKGEPILTFEKGDLEENITKIFQYLKNNNK